MALAGRQSGGQLQKLRQAELRPRKETIKILVELVARCKRSTSNQSHTQPRHLGIHAASRDQFVPDTDLRTLGRVCSRLAGSHHTIGSDS